MNEFDINVVIAEFMGAKLNELMTTSTNVILDAKKKIKINLKLVYQDYLERTYERYGKSKSFFIREEAIAIEEFYIPVGLKTSKLNLPTANLKGILKVNNFCTIAGTSGAGKTILLKYLLIESLKNKVDVPIFIELRDLNSNEHTLYELIKKTTENFGLDVDNKHF